VVLEDDEAIYKSVIQPLILGPLTKVFKKLQLDITNATADFDEEEELHVPNIVQKI
jgi:hypothetical protein